MGDFNMNSKKKSYNPDDEIVPLYEIKGRKFTENIKVVKTEEDLLILKLILTELESLLKKLNA